MITALIEQYGGNLNRRLILEALAVQMDEDRFPLASGEGARWLWTLPTRAVDRS